MIRARGIKVTVQQVSGTDSVLAWDRGPDGEEVARGTVDDDGNWAIDISGLECDEEYTVTQTVGDEESDPTSFTTVACEDDDDSAGGKKKLDRTDGAIAGGLLLAALALMGAGTGLVTRNRRRET